MTEGKRGDEGGDKDRQEQSPTEAASRAAAEAVRAQTEARLQHRRSIRETWWPPVSTPEAALRVARYGFWAAVINVILAAALVVVLLSGGAVRGLAVSDSLLYWAIAEAVVFVVLAWGLYRCSVAAAIAALIIFSASKVLGWAVVVKEPSITALLIAALFLLFYIHGVRGCLALARFAKARG